MTRLRVVMISPNSDTCTALDGDRSRRISCSNNWYTFWRFFRSSMSMKSSTMMPPRSRRRICRTISFAASRLVLTMVSSSLPVRLPT